MKAVAVTEEGVNPVEPDQDKSFEQNLEDASEIVSQTENVHFIIVQK